MYQLEAYEIRKSYNSKEVLKGISLIVHQGEIISILGQNGAGKTTTIKILSTLLGFDSGKLSLFGNDPLKIKNLSSIRKQIGYVGQDSERSAYARLTAEENLLFFGRLMGIETREVKKRILSLAASFEFEEKLHEQFMKLSGGQKQTMIIMRALLHDPKIIFLDEPTKGLDPVRAQNIRIFLKKYIKEDGKSLILTSHILPDVEFLSDKVAFMKSGKIEFIDTPDNACSLLGYSDIIEVKAGKSIKETKEYVKAHSDAIILSEASDGKLILGTNDFFKVFEMFRNIKAESSIEFMHRKVSLEDSYLHFTQDKLNHYEGEDNYASCK